MVKRLPFTDVDQLNAPTPTQLIGCCYVNIHLSEQSAEVIHLLEERVFNHVSKQKIKLIGILEPI
jgi:hypothetical protein